MNDTTSRQRFEIWIRKYSGMDFLAATPSPYISYPDLMVAACWAAWQESEHQIWKVVAMQTD